MLTVTDYLMFSDVDFARSEVQQDVKNWGVWVAKELKLSGFRFDAVKHYSKRFLQDFIQNLDAKLGDGWFLVGEYWNPCDLSALREYLSSMHHRFNLFDAPLVKNFHEVSTSIRGDLRKVFDGSLVQVEPRKAVTLVMNHDTQPKQALELYITPWFIPLAYAYILLRSEGHPCVFYGDLYGINGGIDGDDNKGRPPIPGIPDLCLARKLYAYGEQNDYWDRPNLIGWVRRGTMDRPAGCAVVLGKIS